MRKFLTFRLRTILLLVMLVCCGLTVFLRYQKWQRLRTVAEAWVAPVYKLRSEMGAPGCPAKMDERQQLDVIKHAILELEDRRKRIAGLQLLLDNYPGKTIETLRATVAKQDDPYVAAIMIRLLGLNRQRSHINVIEPFLSDDHPRRRAAAAEAIGLIRQPSYLVPWSSDDMETSPPLNFSAVIRGSRSRDLNHNPLFLNDALIRVRGDLRPKIERMMVHGSSPMEREAAARSLVAWEPAEYRLRVAEWGVWLSDNGQMDLINEVIDEIPPFVHRTADGLGQFANRLRSRIQIVTKPVVHLTVDRAMAVDLSVYLARGRPWFAYPLPNDFVLKTVAAGQRGQVPSLVEFDMFDTGSLIKPFEGYPWLSGHQRIRNVATFGSSFNQISDIGLRWQSLIVTPEKPHWTAELPSSNSPQHAWWEKLREVPSAWITSRQETERFLYYDGPTRLRSPVQVVLKDGGLNLVHRQMLTRDVVRLQTLDTVAQTGPDVARQAMYLEVSKGGHPTARPLTIREDTSRVELATLPLLKGNAVALHLHQILTNYGLTAAEAGGLVHSWERRFLKTPGRRVLMLLKPDEYGTMCPMIIRPTPTEVVRLGMTLTELEEK